MTQKRNKKENVTKQDLFIALIVIGFILTTAILSYFCGEYGILKYIAGGEKLFRFWIIIGAVILGLECIKRFIKKN